MSVFFVNTLDNVRCEIYIKNMRDGLFRSAPVPKTWKKFGRRVSREADYGPRSSEAMEEALRIDAKPLKVKIQQFMIQNDLPSLIGEDYLLRSFLDKLDPSSQLEKDFKNAVLYKYSKRSSHGINSIFRDSFAYALARYRDAMISEFKGHALKKCRNDIVSFKNGVRALDAASDGVNIPEIAMDCIFNTNKRNRIIKKKKFDYDENLLG